MKKLLLYFFLIFSLSSFSQTYYPFPDSVGIWKQTSTFDQGFSYYEVIFYNIFMNGDTTINGTSYNKLYTNGCGSYMIPIPSPINPVFDCSIDTSNSIYYGALREVNKKVYFLPDSLYISNYFYNFCFTSNWPSAPSLNEELLLYDFNANVGDTILYPHLDSLKMIITSIDSVLIQSDYRKRYNYDLIFGSNSSCSPHGVGYNYVEGIGDIYAGLFSLFFIYFERSETLNCFEDNQVYYSNPNSYGCIISGINEYIKNDVLIYPNPASTNLFIEINNPTQIYFFDITGKEVYSTLINQTKSIIDVSSLKSGLYIVKLIDEKGSSTSKLISVN